MRHNGSGITGAHIALGGLALAAFVLSLGVAIALAAGPPLISATTASEITETSARLEASVNPGGRKTAYRFEYVDQADFQTQGFEAAQSAPVPESSIPLGSEDVPVFAAIGGLNPGTTYHYRIVATNSFSPEGGTIGPERIFATYGSPQKFQPCKNEALRVGAGAGLPDCRAYEQVSPREKNGIDANGDLFRIQAALGGNAITFVSNSGIPGGIGGQEFPTYLSRRGEGGWSTEGLLPPPSFGPRASVLGFTPDLAYAFDMTSAASVFEPSLLSRASSDGSFQTIVPGVPDAIYAFAGASADDSKIFIEATGAKLTPSAASGRDNLYLFDRNSGTLSLVGVLPDSACATPPCTPPGGSFAGPYDWWGGSTSRGGAAGDSNANGAPGFFTQTERAISATGDRAYFTAGASAKEAGQIYLREGLDSANPSTALVSTSERISPDPLGARPAAFMAGTSDGSGAFFTSPEKLTDDANTGPVHQPPTIARADIDGNNPNLDFLPTHAAGLAVDGSHIYWANSEAGTIERSNLEGKEVDEEFITGASSKWLAVEGEYIYWTNDFNGEDDKGTIGRAKIGATKAEEVDQEFIKGASNPQGIAVNATSVYWANSGTAQHRGIARASRDGSGIPELSIIKQSGGGEPFEANASGLAIDASHIYFVAGNLGSNGGCCVFRANLDGSEFEFVVGENADRRLGLAVDESHLYWTELNTSLIGRSNLAGTEVAKELVKGAGHPVGLAVDASHLYWSANQEKAVNPGNDLYRYDVKANAGHHLTDLTADSIDENGAEVQGLIGTSEDGSYLYFVANADLDGIGPAAAGTCERSGVGRFDYGGECSLYLHHDGEDTFVARLDAAGDGNISDAANWQPNPAWGSNFSQVSTGRVSPDGQTLLFRSQRQLGAYNNAGEPELYRYRVGEAAPSCISCNPTGAAPVGRPTLQSIALPTASGQTGVQIPSILTRNLSSDGGRVFFETPDKLVGADTNGVRDVYEWEALGEGTCTETSSAFASQDGGCLYLLSTGKGAYPSFLADVSDSGADAFIFTRDPLVAEDADRIQDVYDVRVLGGLASQNQAPPQTCESVEACHGPSGVPPAGQSPSSFNGPPNPKPRRRAKHRKSHKKQHRTHHHRKAKGGTGR